MSELFLTVVNMSISASWIVLAVLALRLLFKKAPKWITVALWGIVAVRLVCPFAIESAISLIPSAETINPGIMMDKTPEINTGIPAINSTINPVISSSFSPEYAESANPLQILIPIFSVAWLVGIAAMLIYTGISYWRIKRKISTAFMYRDNIFQSENVVSPFVLGIVKPKIYLPFKMNDKDTEYVIAHEMAHISRKDYIWKPLGFLLLALHWFNPVMWLGYVLLCRDIELACDEKVVKDMNTEQRADYSQALLTCSVNRRMIAACPLAFGEVGVKERVKTVLNYKKPAFWIIVMAVVAGVAVAVCFLTNPMSTEDNHNANTISFDGKTLNKSDLSQETIEWLEWYNGLSETEQMATDYIPNELLYLYYAEQTGGGVLPVETINSVDGEPLETRITQTANAAQSFIFPASGYGKSDTKSDVFSVEPFRLIIQLPDEWNTVIPREFNGNGITSENSPIRVIDGENQIATIDFNIFDPTMEDPSSENYYKAVYNELMLGSLVSWNCDYTVICKTATTETACCKIMTPQIEPENYHSGILAYNSELGVYISIYFDSIDISAEQINTIAESIVISSNE